MRKRGPGRLLLFFALSVVVPAVVLAVLAYGSVEKEKRALHAERQNELQRAALRIRSELSRVLGEIKAEENRRPWYQYNTFFFEPNSVGKGTLYLQSPIALAPSNPLVEGYFQATPEGGLQSPNDYQTLKSYGVPTPQEAQQAGPTPGPPPERDASDPGPMAPPPGQRDPADPQPAPEEGRRQGQMERTRRALTNAGRNLKEELEQLREDLPQAAKGSFPEVPEQNRKQWLSRRAVDANLTAQKKRQEIAQGQVAEVRDLRDDARGEEALEVDISPFVFRVDPEEGVVAYRYVDVPNASAEFGRRPFVRLMQGFTLDTPRLFDEIFPGLADRYLDVPGARAALLRAGEDAEEGTVVHEEAVGILPEFRVVVTDTDEGWVDRRVSRLSLVLLAVAGGLLLVILGGLAFTVRTVRAELGLARRKSDFVAAVTHELRTPLTGIKMYADMLQAGWVRDEETQNEYVGFMAEESDRLTRLVNRVLDFARTDRAAPEVRPLDLEVPIREVEKSFGPYLEDRGFDLRVRVEDRRQVLAEPDAVKQILLNLLENAVKYAVAAGDRTVTVSVDARGDRTVLSVADHGPGVPPAERERVFLDFYRPGEELTRVSQGAGIGLALVRRLAESMGGTAKLRETPGGGATFRVSLRSATSA